MKIAYYIYLATGTTALGIVMVYATLFICRQLGIDLLRNIWLLGIPIALSLILNVLAIELYKKLNKK